MNLRMISRICVALGLVGFVAAEEGKSRYEMLCGVCHGIDGKGAGEAGFPPLAGSDWVKGSPDRMVQVILHGLEGPITVSGKDYNLMMPPQGAALTDPQIAEIATYIRGAWGNEQSAVTTDQVAQMRSDSQKQTGMWTASQLDKKWPVWRKKGPVKNLIASYYKGRFNKMPDFSKLTPDAVEEEAGGYLSLDSIAEKDNFAMVWEGEFEVRQDRDYTFRIDSDDGSRLFINDVLVAEVKGLGGMGRPREGRALLKTGTAKIRVEYFERSGNQGIGIVMMRGGPKGKTLSFTKQALKKGPKFDPIPIVAKDTARIYRNYIKGTSARGIGVGYPGQVNLAYSADDLSVSQAWVGDFIDAGLHWTGRGQGRQSPAGQRVVSLGEGPAMAVLKKKDAKWPKAWQKKLKARFHGYRLDEFRRPEFHYQAGGLEVYDKPEAVKGREIVRNFRIVAGEKPPKDLLLRLSGPGAKLLREGVYEVGRGVRLKIAESDQAKPALVDGRVVLKLKLSPGENRMGVRYVWK